MTALEPTYRIPLKEELRSSSFAASCAGSPIRSTTIPSLTEDASSVSAEESDAAVPAVAAVSAEAADSEGAVFSAETADAAESVMTAVFAEAAVSAALAVPDVEEVAADSADTAPDADAVVAVDTFAVLFSFFSFVTAVFPEDTFSVPDVCSEVVLFSVTGTFFCVFSVFFTGAGESVR